MRLQYLSVKSATVLQGHGGRQSVPEDDGRESVGDYEQCPGGQGRVSVGVAEGLVVTEKATEKWVTCICI